MARGIDLRTNLTAGELDPALYGRTDLKNYFNAAKRIRNALVVPQGGAKRRSGTRYVSKVSTKPPDGAVVFDFSSGVEGWTASTNCTLSQENGVLKVTHTANGEVGFQIDGLSVDGGANTIVAVRARRVAGSGGFRGALFPWWTPNSAPDGAFAAATPVAAPDDETEWNVFQWDLTTLASGTEAPDGWVNNTVLGFRLDLGQNDENAIWEVDWIAVTNDAAVLPSDTRLIEFEFSTEEHYLFLVQHLEAEIYKNGTLVATIALPYSSDDIRAEYDDEGNLVSAGISWTQSYDTLLIFHEDYAPRRILRGGDDATWTVDVWPVKNVPFFDFGNDYSSPITATGSTPNGTGANAANLVDDDDTTTCTNTPGNLSSLPIEDRIIFQIDLGSVMTVQSIEIVDFRTSGSTIGQTNIYISDDATSWTEIGDDLANDGSEQDQNLTEEFSCRYVGIAPIGGNYGSVQFLCDGINAFLGRTAVDEVQTIDFDETKWASNDETFSLILEGEQTEPIDYNSDATIMRADIESALRRLPNTSATGIGIAVVNASDKNFSVTFSGDDGGRPWEAIEWEVESGEGGETISILRQTRGVRAGEPVWSDDVGYPRCGTFFQGRLIVAGSRERPSTVWASRAGDIWDFNTQRKTADYAIEATADTDQVSSFFAINAGRHLQLFSSDAEFYVPSSDTDGITPQNFALRRSTKRGARAGLPVFDVDGAAMFVQRGGKTLREFIFTDTELAYQANNISLLASHLMRQPVAFSYQQAQSTEDADYLLMANADGSLTAYCTLRTQEVNAYTLQETDGLYHDVQVDLQEVFQVAERTIDSSTVRYLEVWDARMRFDCGAADFDVTTPITTITGLSHLEGETVGFVVDGVLQTAMDTVTGGSVDLPVEATSSWQLGIPFPDVSEDGSGDEWCIEMLPPEMQLDSGPVFGNKYRIMEVTVGLADTTGLKLNNERKALTGLGDTTMDLGDSAFSGVVRYKGFGGWGFEQTMKLSDDRAGHAEVLAIKMRVQV
jgi:hypothetical protein